MESRFRARGTRHKSMTNCPYNKQQSLEIGKLELLYFVENQDIAHAVKSQKQQSDNAYKQDYKAQMVGQPPFDPSSAYPEHDLHKKMTKLASKVS